MNLIEKFTILKQQNNNSCKYNFQFEQNNLGRKKIR